MELTPKEFPTSASAFTALAAASGATPPRPRGFKTLNGTERYYVDKILGRREHHMDYEYLVLWEGKSLLRSRCSGRVVVKFPFVIVLRGNLQTLFPSLSRW